MDRYWLLSSTFYGARLPGDPRGFVGRVRDARPEDPPSPARIQHDRPGTPCDANLPGLHRASADRLKGAPICLTAPQAEVLVRQFRETAAYRHWALCAVAVMADHAHLVLGVPGDPDPHTMLRDFKAYGARALSAGFGRPASGTWWTSGGSVRKLADAAAVCAAVNYVLYRQPHPLVRWAPDPWPAPLQHESPGERGA